MTKQLILTGGSRGIGKATLALFQQHGWQVANLSRHHCELDNAAQINVDLSDLNAVNDLQDTLQRLAKNAKQCCLIHNACQTSNDCIGEQNIDALQHSLTLAITSTALLNNILLPVMKRSSSVLYLGSTLSEIGVANSASYVTIKHATVGMMRASCQDLASTGIHTACVCPGFTDTEMLREHLPNQDAMTWVKSQVGANRLIEPQEIAELLLFCADHAVINGSVLHANLGQLQS